MNIIEIYEDFGSKNENSAFKIYVRLLSLLCINNAGKSSSALIWLRWPPNRTLEVLYIFQMIKPVGKRRGKERMDETNYNNKKQATVEPPAILQPP